MKKVLSVILAIVMIATCAPMAFAEGECEHDLVNYVSTDYGLTVERCSSCDTTSVTVDKVVLNNITTDIYIREFSRFESYYSTCVYESEEALVKIDKFQQDAYVIFKEEISDVYGQEGFTWVDCDISKDWIDDNSDKLPVITLVCGYVNAMVGKAITEGEISVVIDTVKFTDASYAVISGYPEERLLAFMENLDQDILSDINEAIDELNYVLFDDKTSDQTDFDLAAAPVIAYYIQMKNCLDGVHNSEFTDLGNGTHKAACTFCKSGEIIEAHTWGEYTPNGNATTEADGTKTAKCDKCDATDTVADEGSKLVEDIAQGNFFNNIIDKIMSFFESIISFFKNLFN